MRLKFLLAGSVVLTLAMTGSSRIGVRNHVYRYNYENVLGTSAEIRVLAASEEAADKAESAAMDEIERLNLVLSGYTPASEFSKWVKTSGEPVAVSPELAEVLELFDTWRDRTDGALDASADAASRVWKKAAAAGHVPSEAELSAVAAEMRQAHWKLGDGTATHLDSTPLVLNSLAKSYVIGKAAAASASTVDVSGVVVNIGGDLVARGNLVEPVNIADPRSGADNSSIAAIGIENRAVATSGNYRRGVEIGGKHYSHIIDPRTGQTAEDVISSTVVAPNAAAAGALATAFSVMKPADSARLAVKMPGVEYLLVRNNGERIASAGWSGLAAKAVTRAMPVAPMMAATAGTFDTSLELVINVELARMDGFRAKRPYLAAWIVDQDKFPVRTVALWFEKPRWLNELRAWYKDDRLRSMAEGTDITRTVSGATRSPGKYSLKWDGKDNAGKVVKAGKYTVMIECAREHGSYQLLHQEIDFNGKPQQFALPGGTEIAAASVEYRKAGQ